MEDELRAYHIKLRIIQSLWLSGKERAYIRAYAENMRKSRYSALLLHENLMRDLNNRYTLDLGESVGTRIILLKQLHTS